MDINSLQNAVIGIVGGISGFYKSPAFSVLKFILGIYTVVVLADIILLLIQRGLSGDIRDTLIGMNIPPELSTRKNKLKKKWEKIKSRLESKNESEYKVAIIEADNVIDDLIARMGYDGNNMAERLDSINPGQIDNIEDLRVAHKVRNRIIHEDGFKLSLEETKNVLGYYEKFLDEFDVFR
jgi:hypothetical protein